MPSPLSPMLLVPCWLHGPPFLVLPALLFVPRLKILALRPSADLHPPSPPTSSLHQAAEHESTKGQVGTTEALRSLASAGPSYCRVSSGSIVSHSSQWLFPTSPHTTPCTSHCVLRPRWSLCCAAQFVGKTDHLSFPLVPWISHL